MSESLGYQLVVKKRLTKEEWIKAIHQHAKELSKKLGEEVLVNKRVLEAEIKKWEREGLPYCVCRFEKKPSTICPCTYHIDELKKYGRCKCGLFWTKRKCEEFKDRIKREVSYCT
jgi:ferredoxin-thioredoxin reductase catalytic subunit